MKENSPYYADWYKQARMELDMAEVALGKGYLEKAAVNLHQAVEKALKGFIIRNGERPPRTHDLGVLLDRVRPHLGQLEEERKWLEVVSRYYGDFHYPSDRAAGREILVSDMAAAKGFLEKLMGEEGRG